MLHSLFTQALLAQAPPYVPPSTDGPGHGGGNAALAELRFWAWIAIAIFLILTLLSAYKNYKQEKSLKSPGMELGLLVVIAFLISAPGNAFIGTVIDWVGKVLTA